jgi:hypothetical protein
MAMAPNSGSITATQWAGDRTGDGYTSINVDKSKEDSGNLVLEMVSHPPSHSGVRQALALPQIDAERHGEYGHNICLPSVVGHPATSSAPTRRSQQRHIRFAEKTNWKVPLANLLRKKNNILLLKKYIILLLKKYCSWNKWICLEPWTGSRRGRQVLDLESHRSQRTQQMAPGIMEGRRRWAPKVQSREVIWPLA